MHKLDGLTIKIEYDEGCLKEASTRGDGNIGEIVTHNMTAISDVPLKIPYKNRLVVVGEAYILSSDFKVLKESLTDSAGNPYKNSRNLAAGSIRCLEPAICAQRHIRFSPFSVLEGLDEKSKFKNSKFFKLNRLSEFGFLNCQHYLSNSLELKDYELKINELRESAIINNIPIDGIVVTFDNIAFSNSCGQTGHHYKDGLAYKFEDELYETVLRSVEWNPSRFGEITPVAIFDTIEIDGCEVSRASLHNLSFIESLKLNIGCRILISKRNMIIPHVEDNLSRNNGTLLLPDICPSCGKKTKISISSAKASETKTLVCENLECPARALKKLVHFVEKKAMNIDGLSEATLEKLVDMGWVKSFIDIYNLSKYKNEIISMDGFGEKSYNNLIQSIENSRNTTFENFLIAMDIPLVGRNASKNLHKVYKDLKAFLNAVDNGIDFSLIEDIGEIINTNIQKWFSSTDNRNMWDELYCLMVFAPPSATSQVFSNNPFSGCIVVATGTLVNFTRSSINAKLEELGAKVGDSVSKKTNYVIAGEKAGGKLEKARTLGIPILTEEEFLAMINSSMS